MANITTAGTSDFPTSLDTRNTLTGGSTGSDILVEHYNGAAASIINLETVLGARKTQGSVLFAGVSGNYTESNAQLFWDNTNNRLGIGTASPSVALDVTGNYNIRGVGPHAIGGATNSDIIIRVLGTLTGMVTNWTGLQVDPVGNPPAGGTGFGGRFSPTINKAASGTHADFASVLIDPPTIGAGAAALTNSSTIKINGAPTVGTNLRALWSVSGVNEFGGQLVFTSTVSSPIAAGSRGIGTGDTVSLAYNVLTGGVHQWTGNGAERMRLTDTGILALGTTVTTGAGAGSIVVPFSASGGLRSVNAAGSTTVRMLDLQITDAVVIAGGGNDIMWGRANVALGGGAAPTLGTIGVSGPAAAAQRNWLRFIESDGTASFIPVWR